ncbi:hypothetical protein [Luteolibacter sp. Populi]|uniref:hypothetical protein n=1 Tax=Luteolibacter sp. Populi TaxID=3230487 RepID=UPI003465D0D4
MNWLLPLAALSAAFLASCAPSTPASRIAAQPAVYEGLSGKEKQLVSQGQIDKGMGTEAVYLAWGRATREYEGSETGARTLRWDYTSTTPVSGNAYGYFGAFGWGSGRFGPYGGPYGYYPSYGYGQEVVYAPYLRARVLFRNGRVSSWEKSR